MFSVTIGYTTFKQAIMPLTANVKKIAFQFLYKNRTNNPIMVVTLSEIPTENLFTEHCCRLISISAFYSGGTGFESGPGERSYCLKLLVVFLAPTETDSGIQHENVPIPFPFKFIFQNHCTILCYVYAIIKKRRTALIKK
jgi:hypothetical protein